MRKRILWSGLSFLLVASLVLTGCPPPTEEVVEEPSELPWLRVEGNRIVDEDGSVRILRGVNIADPYFLVWENHFTEADFAELSKNWNVEIIRIPVHPGLWKKDPDYITNYLDPLVSWSKKYGMYILIEWHGIGDPVTGETYHPPWEHYSPWYGNPYDSCPNLTASAWHMIAERYKDKSWVLYDIFNEPVGIIWGRPVGSALIWNEWRPVAENLIDIIRSHNPKALIFVGGVRWAGDLRNIKLNPIRRENIVYASHVYPNFPRREDWEEYWGYLTMTHPVFVSEWGYDPKRPEKHYFGTRQAYGEPLLDYMENKVAGWTAWVWHPTWGPPMFKQWENYEPTEFGEFVKAALTASN